MVGTHTCTGAVAATAPCCPCCTSAPGTATPTPYRHYSMPVSQAKLIRDVCCITSSCPRLVSLAYIIAPLSSSCKPISMCHTGKFHEILNAQRKNYTYTMGQAVKESKSNDRFRAVMIDPGSELHLMSNPALLPSLVQPCQCINGVSCDACGCCRV
jgi:hypothetical protein